MNDNRSRSRNEMYDLRDREDRWQRRDEPGQGFQDDRDRGVWQQRTMRDRDWGGRDFDQAGRDDSFDRYDRGAVGAYGTYDNERGWRADERGPRGERWDQPRQDPRERFGDSERSGNWNRGSFAPQRWGQSRNDVGPNVFGSDWGRHMQGSDGGRGMGGGLRGRDFDHRFEGMHGGFGQRDDAMHTRGESFRGRGPKGYTRSDERIRDDINDRLTDHDEIDASEIDVQVKSGEVTLTGTVERRSLKYAIEHLVDGVSGVRDIENKLRVQREAGTSSASKQNQSSQSTVGNGNVSRTAS